MPDNETITEVTDTEVTESEVEEEETTTSIVNENGTSRQLYELYLLAEDVESLPVGNHIKSGSTAFCVDTGAAYIYLSSTQEWYAV